MPARKRSIPVLVLSDRDRLLLKRIGIGLAILIAVVALVLLLAGPLFLNGLLEKRLKAVTAQSSEGVYGLEMDRLNVNLLSGSAVAEGVRLRTDSLAWAERQSNREDQTPPRIEAAIGRVSLDGFGWLRYWLNKDLRLDGLVIDRPDISYSSIRDSVLEKDPAPDTLTRTILDRLPEMLAPLAQRLYIGSVSIRQGRGMHRADNFGKITTQRADSVDWELTHIDIDIEAPTPSGKALYAENIILRVRNYVLEPPGGLYRIGVKEAEVVGEDQLVDLRDLAVEPLISEAEWSRRHKVRRERFDFTAARIAVFGLDLFRALHKLEWEMRTVQVEDPRMVIYLDKNLPLPDKKLPHDLVRKMSFYLSVDSVLVRRGYIRLNETLEDKKGLLEFEKAYLTVTNLTNDPDRMTAKSPAVVAGQAELMGAGLLKAWVELPLLSADFDGRFGASLGAMPMPFLNPLMAAEHRIRIDSGTAERVVVEASIRNGQASGTVKADYRNIKVSLLQEDSNKKKPLLTRLINWLLPGSKDDKDPPPDEGKIDYRRKPEDGFLRFLWKSTESGLIPTLLPVKVVPKGKGNKTVRD